jgi:hypothetical protein
MHVTLTAFIVTWVSLIILIKDCNSGLVSRVLNKHFGEINVFSSAEDVAGLDETFGSQSLQWENNWGHDIFDDKSEVTSEDMEFGVTNGAVSREFLQGTDDMLLKWLGITNIDLSPEQDDSRVSDEDWSITYNYQHHTDDWFSGYERDLIKKMFDQEWFSWNPDTPSEKIHEGDNLEFACVTNELWESFSAIGRNRHKDCEFTCDFEGVPEGTSRWRRFLIRAPGCRKGSRRIRKACRLVWG